MKFKLALLIALVISNLVWFGRYRNLAEERAQIMPKGARPITRYADGTEKIGAPITHDTPIYRGQMMPDPFVYQIQETTTPEGDVFDQIAAPSGELEVYCLNGADATIRPQKEFGSLVVSCGK